jgi:hypothetical protein
MQKDIYQITAYCFFSNQLIHMVNYIRAWLGLCNFSPSGKRDEERRETRASHNLEMRQLHPTVWGLAYLILPSWCKF